MLSSKFKEVMKNLESHIKDKKDLEYALEHFKLCDNLIVQMRRSAFTKTDKLELGALAIKCYEGALEVCTELIISKLPAAEQEKYEELAFWYWCLNLNTDNQSQQ